VPVYEIHGTADTNIPYNGGVFTGVGGAVTVLSAPKSVATWAKLDHCEAKAAVKNPSSTITVSKYSR
jgi:polyhydroxybutyrate depolymerase